LLTFTENQVIAAGGVCNTFRFNCPSRASNNDADSRNNSPCFPNQFSRAVEVGFQGVEIRVVEIADADREIIRLSVAQR